MGEKTEMQVFADKVKDMGVTSISTLTDKLYAEIVESDANVVMPERVFVDKFLHGLAGINSSESKSTIINWLNVAGSPFSGVDIVNDEGELVITTPGLFTRPNIDMGKTSDLKLTSMTEQYMQIKNVDGVRADNFATSKLSSLPSSISIEEKVDMAKWSNVFKHYDKELKGDSIDKVIDNKKQETDLEDNLTVNYD